MNSNQERKESWLDASGFIGCLLIALGLRLFVILNQSSQLAVDRDAYLGIASSIAEGNGYCGANSTIPSAFRPPLYPLALAIGYNWFSTEFIVATINLLTGLLTVWLTVSLGRRLQLGYLRFLAALLVAVDPLLLQYSSRPMTESFCTFLTALWLRSVIPSPQEKSALNTSESIGNNSTQNRSRAISGLISGIAFGLLVLSRPTFWVIAGFFCCKWLAERFCPIDSFETSLSTNFRRGIFSATGTLVTVAPWVIRNWLVIGIPILTTTHGGYTLLLGNNPVFYNEVVRQPWGTQWSDVSQQAWFDDLEAQMRNALGPEATEVERDQWQSRLAKSYIAADPGRCFEAAIHRIRSLWNTVPQGDAKEGINKMAVVAVGWFYAIVLTTGFLGMATVLACRDRSRWFSLYALILSVQLVHLLYWTNTRMRAPLTPAIALFAVAGISRIWSYLLRSTPTGTIQPSPNLGSIRSE